MGGWASPIPRDIAPCKYCVCCIAFGTARICKDCVHRSEEKVFFPLPLTGFQKECFRWIAHVRFQWAAVDHFLMSVSVATEYFSSDRCTQSLQIRVSAEAMSGDAVLQGACRAVSAKAHRPISHKTSDGRFCAARACVVEWVLMQPADFRA